MIWETIKGSLGISVYTRAGRYEFPKNFWNMRPQEINDASRVVWVGYIFFLFYPWSILKHTTKMDGRQGQRAYRYPLYSTLTVRAIIRHITNNYLSEWENQKTSIGNVWLDIIMDGASISSFLKYKRVG